MFTTSLFQGLLALQTPNRAGSQPPSPLNLSNITIPLMVAGMYHVDVPLNGSLIDTNQTRYSTWPTCQHFQDFNGHYSSLVAVGLIFDHGTGMTLLGTILQGIVLVTTFLIMTLLLWPILPLAK